MVPRAVRDGVYRLVARNRYRWFGHRDACMVPSPEVMERFLDASEPRQPIETQDPADREPGARAPLRSWALRLIKAYGTEARLILGNASSATDLGQDFGATLTAAEVRWLMDKEYAVSAEDVVWRRSKLGLRLSKEQVAALDAFMAA